MRIIKYQWSVWRISRVAWFVLITRRDTKQSTCAIATSPDQVRFLDPAESFPDVRLFFPAVQENLPYLCRAIIRGACDGDNGVVWR